MNVGQRSGLTTVSKKALSRDTLCISCLHHLAQQNVSRRHASTAAAVAEESTNPHLDTAVPPETATGPRKAFRLLCSPVLSRPPQLTRELTSFEKSYYLYQKRLNERLALSFQRYFYYKKGTPADVEWKRKIKARRTPARDVGVYNAYAEDGWNDEVLIGSQLGDRDDIVDKLIRDAEGKDIVDGELQGDADAGGLAVSGDAKAGEGTSQPLEIAIERPMPRITEADRTNNLQSLNRRLDRTLYLLMRNKEGRWRFPEDRLYGRESLHQASERILLQAGGLNMNTWVVGNHPVGHYQFPYSTPITATVPANRLVSKSVDEGTREEHGEKVFFMKARIMAGQADLSKNEFGHQEFQWLAKEEIQPLVGNLYWRYIRNMLADR